MAAFSLTSSGERSDVNSWQCRNAATGRLAVTQWALALLAEQHDGPNARTVDIMHDCRPDTRCHHINRHDVRIPGRNYMRDDRSIRCPLFISCRLYTRQIPNSRRWKFR